MELTMLAYQDIHIINDAPWRCVECEHLTRHTDADIIPHLVGAHNFIEGKLSKDHDSVWAIAGTSN